MANTSHLSWQSAFWAVVPIALNTMSFQSGKVLGYPSTWNFVLRSSPVVCAASTLDSVVRLVYYMWTKKSLTRGVEHWTDVRFEDVEETDDGSLENLRRNRYFILVLFLLGALPQAVKIFAVQGAVWTQICCAAYLSSFLLDAPIMLLCPRRSRTALGSPPIISQGNKYITSSRLRIYSQIMLGIAILFIQNTLAHTVRKQAESPFNNWVIAQMVIFSCLNVFVLVFSFISPMRIFTGSSESRFVAMVGFLISGTSCGIVYSTGPFWGFWTSMKTDDLFHWAWWSRYIIWPTNVGYLCVYLPAVLDILQKTGSSKPSKQTFIRVGLYFALLHLWTAGLFYRYAYDPLSTYKPPWTNQLG